jgi:spore coat protein A
VLTKYVDPLPRPPLAIPRRSVYPGTDYYEIAMLQRSWQFHRDLGRATTWGYWATNPSNPAQPIGMGYLGPTIETHRKSPVVVKYRNDLPTTHLFQSSIGKPRKGHGRGPMLPPGVNVPCVVHLHGNFTPSQSDGLAGQWFTPDGIHGPDYATLDKVQPNEAIYGYPNDHEACMFWYHDHAMTITRLNVYAGLAALYFVRDSVEERLGLPRGDFEVPLILQDKTFNLDGSLLYNLDKRDGGETPVVNGKAYPFLTVEPRRYRLRILDASNSRFWRLRFDVGRTRLPFWLIGTDDGFRGVPLQMSSILLGPAERADVIIDFSQVPPGTKITLRNFDARVHFPNGGGPTIREVMQFQVTKPLSSPDRTTLPNALALPLLPQLEPTPGVPRREFVMSLRFPEKKYMPENPYLINGLPSDAPNEDFIKVGTTEIWEYINTTHDAHPVHNHLVQFQVYNRQKFNVAAYLAVYRKWLKDGRNPATKPVLANYLIGNPIPPDPDELSAPKDTVKAYTGMVTRIIQRFDVPGGIPSIPGSGTKLPTQYIHHCHILEHEDNDKMRPWEIVS